MIGDIYRQETHTRIVETALPILKSSQVASEVDPAVLDDAVAAIQGSYPAEGLAWVTVPDDRRDSEDMPVYSLASWQRGVFTPSISKDALVLTHERRIALANEVRTANPQLSEREVESFVLGTARKLWRNLPRSAKDPQMERHLNAATIVAAGDFDIPGTHKRATAVLRPVVLMNAEATNPDRPVTIAASFGHEARHFVDAKAAAGSYDRVEAAVRRAESEMRSHHLSSGVLRSYNLRDVIPTSFVVEDIRRKAVGRGEVDPDGFSNPAPDVMRRLINARAF